MENNNPSSEEKKMQLRLPSELHRALVALAHRDLRSLHAEILVLLREAITARSSDQKE